MMWSGIMPVCSSLYHDFVSVLREATRVPILIRDVVVQLIQSNRRISVGDGSSRSGWDCWLEQRPDHAPKLLWLTKYQKSQASGCKLAITWRRAIVVDLRVILLTNVDSSWILASAVLLALYVTEYVFSEPRVYSVSNSNMPQLRYYFVRTSRAAFVMLHFSRTALKPSCRNSLGLL